jgi:hypothetical protein
MGDESITRNKAPSEGNAEACQGGGGIDTPAIAGIKAYLENSKEKLRKLN